MNSSTVQIPRDYPELLQRRSQVLSRLQIISIPVTSKKIKPPSFDKTDTHWDFLLKEMLWLSDDFASERKRQKATAKKQAMAIQQYFSTKGQRELKALAEFEVKRRKLAAKISREVVGKWWQGKIERVLAYKQKLEGEEIRKKEMDRQLVYLVRQTETYGKALVQPLEDDARIEQALQEEWDDKTDTSFFRGKLRKQRHDTSRNKGENEYASFDDDDDDDDDDDEEEDGSEEYAEEEEEGQEIVVDDESTMEAEEKLGRDMSYADELALLQRENEMSLDDLRAMYYGANKDEPDEEEEDVDEEDEQLLSNGPSSVDDDDDEEDGSEEYAEEEEEGREIVVDDESTMEAEEKLGRDMSYADELALLQRENEMSLDDLRAMYYGANKDEPDEEEEDVDEEDEQLLSNGPSSVDDDDDEEDGSEEYAEEEEEGREIVVDDESTMEAEEKLGRDMSYADELALLQRENEMSLDDLRAMYYGANKDEPDEEEEDVDEEDEQLLSNGPSSVDDDDDEEDGSEEYAEEEEEGREIVVDDESTMEAEEKLGRDMSYADELALLQRENEMSLDDLRAMYYGANKDEPDEEEEDVDEEDEQLLSNGPSSVDDDDDEEDGSEEYAEEEEEGQEKIEAGREYQISQQLDGSIREVPMDDCRGGVCRPHDMLGRGMSNEEEETDEDFTPHVADDIDDETTMEEEEKLGRDMSYEEEIAMLRNESELSIDELRAKYCSSHDEQYNMLKSNNKRQFVTDDDSSTTSSRTIRPKKSKIDSSVSLNNGDDVVERLESSENRIRHSNVSRPFLLSSWVKLRPYQQIGLNWLVSMQARRLNGILADEMGLGKTLQTLCFLSYLACYKGVWGPHLVIVPTSCLVNWETEIKRFTPAFKVLCYYGSAKRRKELRQGWKKQNVHHIIITSYQLAVQDSAVFKRKKWYYLILDEAQNIKNYESERWKVLVTFNSQRRLLLTGTPLQNNLMELWSLLHFLMPNIFQSRKEFSYWFSNPLNSIIEGNSTKNDEIISRLHAIIRPFVLRRLKKDVETQLPGKYEHVIKCQMSRRQMFLYEEYMSRSSTRSALQKGGNYMGMMNVLMQLRKVCNHPDLFEPRSIITPFFSDPLVINTADSILHILEQDSPLSYLSQHRMCPLWSFMTDISASNRHPMSHGSQCPERETMGLLDNLIGLGIDFSGLGTFLHGLADKASFEKSEHSKFLFKNNFEKCQCSMPYSQALLSIVRVNLLFSDTIGEGAIDQTKIANTPKELLEMRRSLQQRSDDIDEIGKRITFCIPKAGAQCPILRSSKTSTALSEDLHSFSSMSKTLRNYLAPFRKAQARLTSFFPDKKLVQFDSGKLQALATLLRDLKHGGHRCLIFTQMSKMLDILEAFLNLNGHTYLRLDGGTGVDKRQRLMDRFNVDKKVFCFILSTRSGGLGINLTGADTVVFYDSDWNAMDAQAQDRAHRIGQTRDVHIYRLVTEYTVEENILLKAKQKRHLDYLVMEKGKFNIDELKRFETSEEKVIECADAFMTKEGLLDILGVDKSDLKQNNESAARREIVESVEQMEKAMELAEDEEDITARCGAQKEVADELKEFDESIQYKNDDDGADSQCSQDVMMGKAQGQSKDPELRKEDHSLEELNALQVKYGLDKVSIEASLSPIERYAMRFRETIDPFYSVWYVYPYRADGLAGNEAALDVNAIETQKDEEEQRALEEGDLLITNPPPDILSRQRKVYILEKARVSAEKLKRKLTGQSWETRIDGLTKHPFWYNVDTGEALWDKPTVLNELHSYERAQQLHWSALPLEPLKRIMEYLLPYPDRLACTNVCKQWRVASRDASLVKFVYPVESGALSMEANQLEKNHYRSLTEALSSAIPGDIIELGDGHFWMNDSELEISLPVKLVGDEDDPSNVVIELNGTIMWSSPFGCFEGVTIRRPKINVESSGRLHSRPLIKIAADAKLNLYNCLIESDAIVREGVDSIVTVPSNGDMVMIID